MELWKLSITFCLCVISLITAEDVRLVDLDPPEAQQLIDSKDTSLKYAPKIESNVPAVRYIGNEPQNVQEDIYLANQYHGQDGLGGYLYGYSVPDIAKTERKQAGGDLRGAYNYLSGGQEIKVEYWDDGNGFHQIDNVPKILPKQIPDSPEVQAAKDEHARRWAEEAERNSKPIQNPYPNAQPGAYAGLGAGVGAGVPNPKPLGQFNPQGQQHGGYQAQGSQQGHQGQQGGYQAQASQHQPQQQNYGQQGQQGFQAQGGYQAQPSQHQPHQQSFSQHGQQGQNQPRPQSQGFGGQQQGSPYGSQQGQHQGFRQQGQQGYQGQQNQGVGNQGGYNQQGQGQSTYGQQGQQGQQSQLGQPSHGQGQQGGYNKPAQGGPGQTQGQGQSGLAFDQQGQQGGYSKPANQGGYQGQHSQTQNQYGKSSNQQDGEDDGAYKSDDNEGQWKDDTNDEPKGPPKGFFYNFDYPVGIIVSKQGSAQQGGSLGETYQSNKANFEQQLNGGAAVHGAGAYPSYQVHS